MGDGKDFGWVEGVDLEFQVVHSGVKANHGFTELLFLGLQPGALHAPGWIWRIVLVLRLGGSRRIDVDGPPGPGHRR